jgi:putative peptide zinc metalloprotease protein
MNLIVNPDVRCALFEGRAEQQRWLYELDDASGRTQRVLLTSALHRILQRQQTVDGPRGAAPAAVIDDTLPTELARQLLELGILIDPAAETRHAPGQSARPSYMAALLPLLTIRWTQRLSAPLRLLLGPAAMIPGLLITLACLLWLSLAELAPGRMQALASSDIIVVVLCGLFGVFLHELGHAAAAYRYGARRVSIGVGWYVCFPVAYADLSEIWRMSRRQRMVVDVAGVYVQGLYLSVLVLGHILGGSVLLLVAALGTGLSMLWNLNPLLRMDGYWLLSDWLGHPSLRASASDAVRSVWRGLRKGQWPELPSAERWLLFYGLLSGLFLVHLLVSALGMLGSGAMQVVPAYLSRLLDVQWHWANWDDLLVISVGLAWKLVLLVFLLKFLLGLALRAAGATRRSLRIRAEG